MVTTVSGGSSKNTDVQFTYDIGQIHFFLCLFLSFLFFLSSSSSSFGINLPFRPPSPQVASNW